MLVEEGRRAAQHLWFVAFHVGLQHAHVARHNGVDAHCLRNVLVRVFVTRAALDQANRPFHRRHAALHALLHRSVAIDGARRRARHPEREIPRQVVGQLRHDA